MQFHDVKLHHFSLDKNMLLGNELSKLSEIFYMPLDSKMPYSEKIYKNMLSCSMGVTIATGLAPESLLYSVQDFVVDY